jgi:excisionase family DNA binding protein
LYFHATLSLYEAYATWELSLIASERVADRVEFLTVEEVSAMLRISPQTIRKHVREGKLPAARFGHFWRVRRSDLEGLFAMRE